MTAARTACLFLLTIAMLDASSCAAEHTKDSLDTVKKNLEQEKAVLVDVREKTEWDNGHIASAVLLPLSKLRNGVTKETLNGTLPEKKILYTHCAAGVRSVTAEKILKELGYEVRALKPGYEDLLEAGFPKAKE